MRNGSKCTHYPYLKILIYFYNSFQLQRGAFRDRQASSPLPSPCQPNLAKGHCCPKDDGAALPLVYPELLKVQKSGFSYILEIPLKRQIYASVAIAWSGNQTSPLCRGLGARTRSWQEGWHSSPDRLAACMHAFKCHSVPTVSKYAAATRELLDTFKSWL